MTNEPKAFIEYWEAVDAAMRKFFGIDTSDAGLNAAFVAGAQDHGHTPDQFARWCGDMLSLTYLDDTPTMYSGAVARTRRIAALNDLCRKGTGVAVRLVQTSGISALPPEDQADIREQVEFFKAFTPDNNPHGERDFGAFEYCGQKISWKIDYYDTTLSKGSEDPANPQQTVRVLTIMLASEY